MLRILAINPGATSTKLAVFDGEQAILKKTIEHQGPELKKFKRVMDQFEYRLDLIQAELEKSQISLATLNAVVGRGGLNLRPVPGGTYAVNTYMLDDLHDSARGEHASYLGGVLAYSLARNVRIPAFIVDPVSVDEMAPEARISGMPELPRISTCHTLNTKAVARKVAKEIGRSYDEVNLVVAHLGTGISVSPHKKGRMIDVNGAQEEGPFSLDRCGGLPALGLAKLCYSGNYTEREMLQKIMGYGGMSAYLGTKDVREAERQAENGDKEADLILNALSYQVSKEIGAMSAVLSGEVDRIILTGGIAYSKRIVDAISARVQFIAPIVVVPGEEEMEALVAGASRVLLGEESPLKYEKPVEE
ncbi:MAG: butyrate kinase [Deltaproteobacteria bacterium]